jgi:hypothetical protein
MIEVPQRDRLIHVEEIGRGQISGRQFAQLAFYESRTIVLRTPRAARLPPASERLD